MKDASRVIETVETIADGLDDFTKRHEAKIDALTERVEKVEAGNSRPGGMALKGTSDQREHKDAFLSWVRNPTDGAAKRHLEDAQHEMQRKAVTIGTDAAGGYAVPALIADEVESWVQTMNPFRQLCNVQRVGSSDYAHLVSKNSAGNAWVAEAGARSESSTSALIERKPTFGTLYAYPQCTEEAMQDVFFNVQDWLVQEVSEAFAAAEATAIVSGNGTARPTGFLNTTPVTTADRNSPERAAGVLQYIPMDSSSPQALGADDIIDLVYAVKEGYLTNPAGCGFVMRRATANVVRKLKDSNGAYLWQPSLQLGQPDMLLGFPCYYTDAMPAHAADAYSVAFGNWNRGYLLADRSEIRITHDDNISTPGYHKFYVRKRVGGCVLNDEAIKVLKFADA